MLYLSPDYKKNFGTFIGALNKGRNLDDALSAAFGKTEAQVFTDLRDYLSRKKLYGTVFMTPFEKSGDTPVVTPVTTYDSYLMLADLQAASHHVADASRLYQQLEADEPKRPDAFASAGYLALSVGQKENARTELKKAYDLGSTDPQLCLQLETLDREANQPSGVLMAELERAVKLRPDFTEAVFQLGVMKVDSREFNEAFDLLNRVGTVGPERTAIFRYAIAYVNLERGNIRPRLGSWYGSRAPGGEDSPSRNSGGGPGQPVKLIDARSKGPWHSLILRRSPDPREGYSHLIALRGGGIG